MLAKHGVALSRGFHDHQIGRGIFREELHGALNAARLHAEMRLRETPVGSRALERSRGVRKFREALDRDSWNRTLMRRRAEGDDRRSTHIVVGRL